MRHASIVIGLALSALGASAPAAPTAGTCAVTEVFSYELFALNRVLPGPSTQGVVASVAVDADAGQWTLDGGSMSFAPYPFPFADLIHDTLAFEDQSFAGRIDAAGNVDLDQVRFRFCTLDTHSDPASVGCALAGTCSCVPGNVCSNDPTDPCVLGASSPCPGGGLCRGVCANDLVTSCASDADCPGSRCGKGGLTPFVFDMTTGISAKNDILVRGTALDFATGTFRIGAVGSTPEEAPVVGSTGTSGFFFGCTLSTVPDRATLPPARWVAGKSLAKLGKEGPGKTDDTLIVTGTVDPIAADVRADGLVLSLAQEDPMLSSPQLRAKRLLRLTVPPQALTGSGKKLKLKDKNGSVVTTDPPSAAAHTVVLRSERSGGWRMKLVSKGLDLDAIGDLPEVLTNVRVGRENGAQARPVTKKKSKLTF